MFKKILSCVGEYKLPSILAPLTVMMEVVLEVLIPLVVKRIVDEGIEQANTSLIIWLGLAAVGMALLSLLFGSLSAVFAARASTGFASNIRSAMFGKVQDFSFHNVDKFSTASLVTRLTTDVNYIQNAYMTVIRIAIRAPFMFAFSLAMAININWKLAMVFVGAVPLVIIGVAILGGLAFPLFERMFKAFDKMNSRVQENLIAIRVVKSFVREGHETKEFRNASTQVLAAQKKAEKIMVFAMPLMQLVMYVTVILIVYLGGRQVVDGSMSNGDLITFVQYINMILMSLIMVSMIFVMAVMSRASIRRVGEVLTEAPDIDDAGANPDLVVTNGGIEFQNVDFNYTKAKEGLILSDLNLSIAPGETVGIVGGTGSAKTTLVQLILRLYDVQNGAVKVGGHDVKDYTLKNLRDAAAIVLQKNVLFSGTIRENLLWGDPSASQAEIETAAKNAAAHDFIISFPEGYDTVLGQGGVNVSGGQKQRLCIARALLKKPKIMILDDSTSAVDTATDALIRKAFREELKGTTVVIIAQRLASVMDADKIVVMNEGRIDAVGTHEELLHTNQIYAEVYESQQKGVA